MAGSHRRILGAKVAPVRQRHITLRQGGPKTREDWLDALELVLGSRAEAERAYEVGTEALRFEEEVLREIAALPETALGD